METYMQMLGRLAKNASREVAKLGTKAKNRGLLAVANELVEERKLILQENAKDIEAAKAKGVKQSLIDRLALTEQRIEDMAEGLRQIAALDDPIGEVLGMKTRPNGLRIGKKRVPLGVVGIIYESRPNVTADAFGLCFKTGNAVILRGGSDAIHSNQAITRAIKEGLRKEKLSQDLILLVEDTSREVVNEMMKMHGWIDVLIPRGGAGLIANVVANSTVPVIETGTGNCHVYVDETADIKMATDIIENAKTQRLGVCNACESLVIHSKIADVALPKIVTRLKEHGVEIRGDERAQAISLELAKQMFPGYQALVVTHTDGHNESGNIHTHIVINSVRKTAVERQPYMDKPHEEAAGYKHRSTDKFMNAFKKTVMDRCQQEGLHQIDLLAPAERKITQKEYQAQKHGQQKLNEINQKIIEDGLKPTSTVFLTQKEYLRNAIDECAATSNSFDEFQSKLLEQFQISVIEHRGRYSYLHPDRQKRITERALGTRYGKEHLEQTFLRKDPLAILYVRSHLRLVVNLQTNVKAMQSPAYAHRVKLSNLQQMANTIIYVQEHGFDTQSDLKNTLLASKQELKEMQTQFAQHRSDLRTLNDQIRYTGQYYANKEVYSQFSNAKYKGKYRKEHAKEIQKYEEARDWLRSFYQDGKMTSLKTLTLQKEKLQQQIASEEEAISSLKEKLKDLDTADQNVDAILQMQIPEPVRSKTKNLER